MSGDRARDALAQCLPRLGWEHMGYRMTADEIDKRLEERGFKIISIATYERIIKQVTHANSNPHEAHSGHRSRLQDGREGV